MRTIQPAQTCDPEAEYDPMVPLPYPYHIHDDGAVGRQDFWKGQPARLLGFARGDVQEITLTTQDWLAGEPDAAVGLCPVFSDLDDDVWSDTRPITRVVTT